MSNDPSANERLRIDKWLWAARFFKTRSLASQAVVGGKVKLNGERPKPAREVRPGDRLTVHIGENEWEVMVIGLSARRGPASTVSSLYEETEASRLRRQEQAATHRASREPSSPIKGRPTKRDRRQIHRFIQAE